MNAAKSMKNRDIFVLYLMPSVDSREEEIRWTRSKTRGSNTNTANKRGTCTSTTSAKTNIALQNHTPTLLHFTFLRISSSKLTLEADFDDIFAGHAFSPFLCFKRSLKQLFKRDQVEQACSYRS